MPTDDVDVSDRWREADLAAGRLDTAEGWRRELAKAIAQAAKARFSAVFTCPPGRPLEAQYASWPEQYDVLVRGVFERYLARIERGPDGSSRRPQGGAFAPLESASDRRLAQRVREELYEPAGVQGLITAPLVPEGSPYWIGWIVVGSEVDSAALMEAAGEPLERVAAIAARTLEHARRLAEAVGVVVPLAPPAPGLSLLSRREREVVELVVSGRTDAEIASMLRISEQTVGSHLKRIYEKLQVHSRVALTARVSGAVRR
ncbi:MAG: helix-turn-helix transcriptional regulator [Myxococcaceae bacterium]|nr:helix-turn-helix transcriptional regulator [Myxococcaceae bacterium]